MWSGSRPRTITALSSNRKSGKHLNSARVRGTRAGSDYPAPEHRQHASVGGGLAPSSDYTPDDRGTRIEFNRRLNFPLA
jgi:hypothetical protein